MHATAHLSIFYQISRNRRYSLSRKLWKEFWMFSNHSNINTIFEQVQCSILPQLLFVTMNTNYTFVCISLVRYQIVGIFILFKTYTRFINRTRAYSITLYSRTATDFFQAMHELIVFFRSWQITNVWVILVWFFD